MSDIPQVYLDEAIRRLNNGAGLDVWGRGLNDHPTLRTFARTLQELGWQPPVDPMLVRARGIVANFYHQNKAPYAAKRVLDGERDDQDEVRIALIALREGMGE